MHSHTDMSIPFESSFDSVIHQGITTQVIGNCGWSMAPVNPDRADLLRKDFEIFIPPHLSLEFEWESFGQYLDFLNKKSYSINLIPLIGFGAVRIAHGPGYENRAPTNQELSAMSTSIEEGMQAGAFGMSTGLVYTPQSYADTEEITYLMKSVAKYGGMHFSHIRGEDSKVISALKEFIQITEKSGVNHGQIAHHKVSGKQNWDLSIETLKLIEEANDRGLDITCDQYPFDRGMTSLVSLLPGWVQKGGLEETIERLKESKMNDRIKKEMESNYPENRINNIGWDHIFIAAVKTKKWKPFEGLCISEITKYIEYDNNFRTFSDILIDEEGEVVMHLETMNETDIFRIFLHPKTMVGTDGWAISSKGNMKHGIPHPRFYGSFPRILGYFVRENNLLSIETAIYKMTGQPAQKLGLKDRGILKENALADLVIFDPHKIQNLATYKEAKYPAGIIHVLVNGEFVVKDGQSVNKLPGKLIRRRN